MVKRLKMRYMNKMLSYMAPEIEIVDIVAERGYGDSIGLPGFGTEQDELVY